MVDTERRSLAMTVQLRMMRVCDYIALPYDTVVGLLDASDGRLYLEDALAAALGGDRSKTTVSAWSPARVARRMTQVHVSWHISDLDGRDVAGDGVLLVLGLQTGREPLTELIATIAVEDELSATASATARRFLDDLTARLLDRAGRFPKSHPPPLS
jgi:hypothetical protein